MSTIHNYYITSQLFQLVEEQIASIEVDKKLKPLAELFVRLFDDLDYNFSNEMVPEALDRLIIFVEKDKVISTVEFVDVESFFTDENDYLFVRVNGEILQVVEPGEGEDDDDDDFEIEEGQEFEEKEEISLDDDESYIVINGDEVIEEYELNEDVTIDDADSYIVIDDIAAAEFNKGLDFVPNPIILDNAHAELITLARTTDLDELIAEQISELPVFREVIDQMKIIRKEVKADTKNKKKKKKKKKKSKSKKDKKSKDIKKDLNLKIAKKLHKYVLEHQLEDKLVLEFLNLQKQIDYILIQY